MADRLYILEAMKETKALSDNFHCNVERRPDSRISRSALDEVKAIQTLLDDVYKDVGDGRTLLRELVQNADDAEAEQLIFIIVNEGWPEAQNSLLRGPALVVANNGLFPPKDHEALHLALGGSKADDAGKVGRFGIGLKSVFHICEAIVYVGADQGVLRPGALNPWAGTGTSGDADPLHPDWDSVGDDDLNLLFGMANTLFGDFHKGLLQWIPLRQPNHLDRAQDRQYGLGKACPKSEDVALWFERPDSLALLLAQCGHLVSIKANLATDPRSLKSPQNLADVVRPNFQRRGWIGRYEQDTETLRQTFEGRIENGSRSWSVLGVEALGLDCLRRLRTEPDWPTDPHWRNGRSEWIPRKALSHASITVLRPDNNPGERCGAHLRWAVFLPLDDDPSPQPNPVVEAAGSVHEPGSWDILFHGYFWPSHDRRSIPGVTDDDTGTGNNVVRIRWNQAVRDELLLPLLPGALANAVQGIPECTARSLLKAVANSQIVQKHLTNVTKQHMLLPEVTENGVYWKAFAVNEQKILSIPGWSEAPIGARKQFLKRMEELESGIVFIDRDAPRIGGNEDVWPVEWVKLLLNCITSEMLRAPQELQWIEILLRHLLRTPSDTTDSRTATVARWLASRIGEGALETTTGRTVTEEQAEMRSQWLKVFAVLPNKWLISTPLATLQAVAELAKGGVIGVGLLPVPLGRDADIDNFARPEIQRLDDALLMLGNRILEDREASQRMRRSRLLLSEVLLSFRGTELLDEELSRLPLLRSLKLPDGQDEAWSIDDLRRQSERHRVFARSGGDGDDDSTLYAPSDPKKAVTELSEGIGDVAWLVDGVVASAIPVPVPDVDALANSVMSASEIKPVPEMRQRLIQRMAISERTGVPIVRSAIIALLTGRISTSGDDPELYYVRRQDSDRDSNQKSLCFLLRTLGRTWCAIDASLVELLPHVLIDNLRIKAVDFGMLQKLLQECLDTTSQWPALDRDEAIHLLRCLYNTAPDVRLRWRQIPLHRKIDDIRGSFDDKALRAVGGLQLPSELESEIQLLEPDEELKDLYRDVPILDEKGILHAMLVSQQPHQFADRIVRALYLGNDDRVVLPPDATLLNLLEKKLWLPLCNGALGVAPGMLILLPSTELSDSVAVLANAGALGGHRLADQVKPIIWHSAEKVVYEILRRPSPSRQIQWLVSAFDSSKIGDVNEGAFLLLPNAEYIDAPLIDGVIQSALADSHDGWSVVRAAAKALRINSQNTLDVAAANVRDSVVSIAKTLCGNVPDARQISALKCLAAGRPSKDSSTGRVFHKFIEAFAQTNVFFDKVLPFIELPTQDGQWHQAYEIARSASGVARRHRLLLDFRDSLHLNVDGPVHVKNAVEGQTSASSADILTRYFDQWINRLPNSAVGAFLALLGNGKDDVILDLAQRWIGQDVSVERMRHELDHGTGRYTCESVRVLVYGCTSGRKVEALNLLRELVEMDAELENDTIFATDPVRRSSSLGDFRTFTLRDVDPNQRTSQDLIALLGNTVEWWAVRALRIDQQAVRSWWSKWGTGSQTQVGPVQASVLSNIPLTLHQLDVRECVPLKDALHEAQRAQRRREQAPPSHFHEAIKTERKALDNLAALIRNEPKHQDFVWSRVQETMKRYGYSEDCVLLELAQNADDALAQSAEINGRPLPHAARRLIVRVAQCDEKSTVDVIHYGRPINDTGGAAFPAGRDRQWDQDLYFMMLLNLSGKPGEISGQSTPASTTGRFGLGFKSVHLVSEAPSVVSGFLAFSIAAGLLPFEQPVPADPDLSLADGTRATRVRLPL
jgi:hypothetical protein